MDFFHQHLASNSANTREFLHQKSSRISENLYVYVSDNMPEMATGNTVVYYGDFKGLATKFSEDVNIQVLREKFADEHATGVIGWVDFDAKVVNEQAIAKLVMA